MKFGSEVDLPVITSSERSDFKRCPKRWYWKWRRGLIPRMRTFGALDLGAWVHSALEAWYGPGKKRRGSLSELFESIAQLDINSSIELRKANTDAVNKADELVALGIEMTKAYQSYYTNDRGLSIVDTEIPLEYTFSNDSGLIVAAHKIKPDGVVIDQNDDVWLIEHKTAKSIQTEHLVIDDQARPYGAMAERPLRKLGIIQKGQRFRGILYNFLRKALPDLRPQNEKGQYLNKDRSVSKRQPPAFFVRKKITMTDQQKRVTLARLADEVFNITEKTLQLRIKDIDPDRISKTPHKSCVRTCQFFTMCVAEDSGMDIRDMERLMFRREDPYLYHKESTEDPLSFEIT